MSRPNSNAEFLKRAVEQFFEDKRASILVCGSARTEREILSQLGFTNVTYTGMDMRDEVASGTPSKFENAESLSFGDMSFDYALIKDTVHHTSLPHKVITELFRVSKKGFLVVEGRDSFLIRLASRLGLTEQFEVAGNFEGHGVNGTDIPNFIFRWTEREVNKTLKSYAPQFNHDIRFLYHSNYPSGHGFGFSGKLIVKILKPIYLLLVSTFPKQQNVMAFFVRKPKAPDDLKPWVLLDRDSDRLLVNKKWIKERYRKKFSR